MNKVEIQQILIFSRNTLFTPFCKKKNIHHQLKATVKPQTKP